MSLVNVTSVGVKNNPCKMKERIQLEIVFESLQPLKQDIDWKVLYCCCLDENNKPKGDPLTSASPTASSSSTPPSAADPSSDSSSASSANHHHSSASTSDKYFHDVELDSISLGPIPKGTLAFELETAPPNYANMPRRALFEMHALLLTGSYNGCEFIRIGWYVSHALDKTAEALANTTDVMYDDDVPLDEEMVMRCILTDEPRITRYPIDWDIEEGEKETTDVPVATEEGGVLETTEEHGKQTGGEVSMQLVTAIDDSKLYKQQNGTLMGGGGGGGCLDERTDMNDGVGTSSSVITSSSGTISSGTTSSGTSDCGGMDSSSRGGIGGMDCEMCTTTGESEAGNQAFMLVGTKTLPNDLTTTTPQAAQCLATAAETSNDGDVEMG
eukprot:GHVS01094018.1.p1 GENE.GHVS01094018.1~~GHVS01094018.1.p1  ORF type:complete len:385 (+),score=114.99 GHVS01094018.1:432-1586(+)